MLVYADDKNLLRDNIDKYCKKKIETLTDASKEVGLEVDMGNTRYVLLNHHQNAGQNHYTKISTRSIENVTQLKYLGMTVTNQNLIYDEIKRILNLGNVYYHLVQNLLSSRLWYTNVKIRIYKTITLHVVLYRC
jgi:hypothetical protein